jgi:hypothetical protein
VQVSRFRCISSDWHQELNNCWFPKHLVMIFLSIHAQTVHFPTPWNAPLLPPCTTILQRHYEWSDHSMKFHYDKSYPPSSPDQRGDGPVFLESLLDAHLLHLEDLLDPWHANLLALRRGGYPRPQWLRAVWRCELLNQQVGSLNPNWPLVVRVEALVPG